MSNVQRTQESDRKQQQKTDRKADHKFRKTRKNRRNVWVSN